MSVIHVAFGSRDEVDHFDPMFDIAVICDEAEDIAEQGEPTLRLVHQVGADSRIGPIGSETEYTFDRIELDA